MSNQDRALDVEFVDPLDPAGLERLRAFFAQLKQQPKFVDVDLFDSPDVVLVAEEFLKDSTTQTRYALISAGPEPVSMFPVQIGPLPNLPGTYLGLFRHPTRLCSVGVTCDGADLRASLHAIVSAMRATWPEALGFSMIGLDMDRTDAEYATLMSLLKDASRLQRPSKLLLYVDLTDFKSLDEYYDSRSRHYKKNYRSGRNRLKKMGAFTYADTGPDGPWSFEQMGEIDTKTWRAEKKEGETPRMLLRMCERFSKLAETPEQTQLCALEQDGKPVSMYYSLYSGPVKYCFKNTFDPEYWQCSPSLVAFHHMVGDAFEAGAERIELMTANAYARPWANRERAICDDVMFFPTLRGRLAYFGVTAARGLNAVLRRFKDKGQKSEAPDTAPGKQDT